MSFETSSFGDEISAGISAKSTVAKILLNNSGGTCIIYKANIHGKWVVIKRIKQEFKNNPVVINCFEKEFEIGFNLDYPHIIKYLNKGIDEEGHYIITEYVEGKNLRELLDDKNPKLSDKKVIEQVVRQLLETIAYLHTKNIFHLDLKPENLIISDKSGNVKLIDFGFAYSDGMLPFSGGTKKYSSPEQSTHPEKVNYRNDLFSFGLIVLELFTGTPDVRNISKLPFRYRRIIKECLNTSTEKYISAENILSSLKTPVINKSLIYLLIIGGILFAVFRFATDLFTGKENNASEIATTSSKWKAMNTLPQGRADGGLVAKDNKLYYIGGYASAQGLPQNNVYVLDLTNGKWTEMKPIPTPRSEMGAVVYNNKIYTFGGWSGETNDAAEVYNIENDNWKSISPLPKRISMCSAVLLNDKIFIVGGTIGTTNCLFFEYNPQTDTYKTLPVFSTVRGYVNLVVINGKIYTAGGQSYSNGYYHMHNNCDEYDPATNRWTEKTAMPIAVEASTSVAFNNELHCIGGRIAASVDYTSTNAHQVYSPEKDNWETRDPLPVKIWGNEAIVVGEKIYCIGGFETLPNATSKVFFLENK